MPGTTEEKSCASLPPKVIEHWIYAKKGLKNMFWISVVSIVLDATRVAWTTEAMTVTHHTIFSRALLMAALIISGNAYYAIPQRNRVSWRSGLALPWLFGFGITTAGLDFAGVASVGWPFIVFVLILTGIIWLFSRSWRRSWRGLAWMFDESAPYDQILPSIKTSDQIH